MKLLGGCVLCECSSLLRGYVSNGTHTNVDVALEGNKGKEHSKMNESGVHEWERRSCCSAGLVTVCGVTGWVERKQDEARHRKNGA